MDTGLAHQHITSFDASCMRHHLMKPQYLVTVLWSRGVWGQRSRGGQGFGHAYKGWKVGSLDGGAYVSGLVSSGKYSILPSNDSSRSLLDPGAPAEYWAWKTGLSILASPSELLRLELLGL